MKVKIRILNFVLWCLGLTTKKTGLVKTVGRKFEVINYSVDFIDTRREMKPVELAEQVELLIDAGIGKFLINLSAVKYVVNPKYELGIKCVGTVLILKVKN